MLEVKEVGLSNSIFKSNIWILDDLTLDKRGSSELSLSLSKSGIWMIQRWIREAPLIYPKVYISLDFG